MGGSGHDVIDVWNVKWNLPDRQINDIPIDPGTNLPLIHKKICASVEKEKYGPQNFSNATVFQEQDAGSKSYYMDWYDFEKSILCCTSVADETN